MAEQHWTLQLSGDIDNAMHTPDAELDALLARAAKSGAMSPADRAAAARLLHARIAVELLHEVFGGASLRDKIHERINRRVGLTK